jgi:hypothetical protein
MKLKSFLLFSFILSGFSTSAFGVTQNIGCGGETFGDVISVFLLQVRLLTVKLLRLDKHLP